MLPKVKEALEREVQNDMDRYDVNWTTIQTANIKKNWGYPMGSATLHKLLRKPTYNSNKQTKNLLNHFKIPFNINYGIITLVEEKDYEQKED